MVTNMTSPTCKWTEMRTSPQGPSWGIRFWRLGWPTVLAAQHIQIVLPEQLDWQSALHVRRVKFCHSSELLLDMVVASYSRGVLGPPETAPPPTSLP